jgi:hypothetical protein
MDPTTTPAENRQTGLLKRNFFLWRDIIANKIIQVYIYTGMKYNKGDRIIYKKNKVSAHPTPRARDVHPSSHGDDYHYVVDKYWIVTDIIDEKTIEAMTRTGKKHRLNVEDPRLSKAGFFSRIFNYSDFPQD